MMKMPVLLIVCVVSFSAAIPFGDRNDEALNTLYSAAAVNAINAKNADSALIGRNALVAGIAKNAENALVAENARNAENAESAVSAHFALKSSKATFAKYAVKVKNMTNETFTRDNDQLINHILKGIKVAMSKASEIMKVEDTFEPEVEKREGIAYASIFATKSLNSINADIAEDAVNSKKARHAGKAENSKYALVAKYAKNAVLAKKTVNGEHARKAKVSKFAMFAKVAEKAVHIGSLKELRKLAKSNGDLEDWSNAFRGKGRKGDVEEPVQW